MIASKVDLNGHALSKSEVGIIEQKYTMHLQVMSHMSLKLLFSSLKGLPPLGLRLATPASD